jgi:hypothetical protein
VSTDGHSFAEDVRLSMPFVRWHAMADMLAEAIRNHGPWMDDECRAVLAKYDAMRHGFDGNVPKRKTYDGLTLRDSLERTQDPV